MTVLYIESIEPEWRILCTGKQIIIGSDNGFIGLSPSQHQDISYTNAGILLIGPLGIVVQVRVCSLGAKPLTKSTVDILSIGPSLMITKHTLVKFYQNTKTFCF